MADYKESAVSGTSWQRAVRVIIDNQTNTLPQLTIVEEEVTNLVNGKQIKSHAGNLSVMFDANNPKHVALYNSLNELYIELREARDGNQGQ